MRHGNVNATKQKVRGASEAEGDAQQLRNRLERIEGDIHRCFTGYGVLKDLAGLDNTCMHCDASRGK